MIDLNSKNKSYGIRTVMVSLGLILLFTLNSCGDDDEDKGPSTDITELNAEIATVESLLSSSVEGNGIGEYYKNSKEPLETALTGAQAVSSNDDATQEEIDAALTSLEDARFAFAAREIEDAALQFSANDSENSIALEQSGNSASIFNRGEFTFETWVYYTDKPGFFGQMASTEFYADGVWGWNVRVGDDDALDFAIGDADGESRLQPNVTDVPEAIVPRNEWVHIACTFDGTTMKSYINGNEIGSLDASDRDRMSEVATQEGAQPLTLGNSAGFKQPERRLVGKMFDVRYWGVARSAAEVKEDMNYIIGGDETGLIGYWPFAKPATSSLITDWASATEGENNLSLVDGAIVSTR
ncbi:MAG: LamG-like jellyroll fold domain-containing protein [Cyclobacteriaceae bacterium]